MKAMVSTATLALVLGSVPGLAFATPPQPLRLELPALSSAPAASRPSAFERSMAPRPARAAPLFQRDNASARQATDRTDLQNRARDLGRQALHNVFDADARTLDESQPGDGQLQLKFKRGNGFSDLNKSYRRLCDNVSQKIWDDPNGKRIRFDVAGKPGVAFEIPVGHHERR